MPEIGTILTGTVTRIAAFGIFLSLEDGNSGMVHISELADGFIKDINTFAKPGDTMRVKVISVDERGRIGLSRKQALTEEERLSEAEQHRKQEAERRASRTAKRAVTPADVPEEYTPYVRKVKESSGNSFEDMMSRYKAVSEEKISDLRKYTEGKVGTGSGRRGGKR